MSIDRHINWELAREKLQGVAEEVVAALRICDLSQLAEDPALWSTEDLAIEEYIAVVELTPEQVLELSKRFCVLVSRAKSLTGELLTTEVNDPCQ